MSKRHGAPSDDQPFVSRKPRSYYKPRLNPDGSPRRAGRPRSQLLIEDRAVARAKAGLTSQVLVHQRATGHKRLAAAKRCKYGESIKHRRVMVVRALQAAGVSGVEYQSLSNQDVFDLAANAGLDVNKVAERCGEEVVTGLTMCVKHLAFASLSQLEAKERIDAMVPAALQTVLKIMTKSKQHGAALKAATDVLDRAGLRPPKEVRVVDESLTGEDDLSALSDEELAQFLSLRKKMQKTKLDVKNAVEVASANVRRVN